jgi:hypothetical protein
MQARRKLLGMLNMHKWRRRQVHSYFLPKSQKERSQVKEKVRSMLAAKEVTQRAANASLRELKDTIVATSGADPLESKEQTKQNLGLPENYEATFNNTAPLANMTVNSTGMLPAAAVTAPEFNTFTTYDDSTRFTGPPGATAPVGRMEERYMANKDIRKVRDNNLRQMTGLER